MVTNGKLECLFFSMQSVYWALRTFREKHNCCASSFKITWKTLGHLVIDDPESLLLLVYVLMQSWSVAWVHPKGIRGIREHHCSTRRWRWCLHPTVGTLFNDKDLMNCSLSRRHSDVVSSQSYKLPIEWEIWSQILVLDSHFCNLIDRSTL